MNARSKCNAIYTKTRAAFFEILPGGTEQLSNESLRYLGVKESRISKYPSNAIMTFGKHETWINRPLVKADRERNNKINEQDVSNFLKTMELSN